MRLIIALLCIAAGSLSAATFTVANVNDSGTGSLREAINLANGAAGDDTIVFGAGVTGQITLASTLPVITQAGGVCTIQGPGRALLTISGGGTVRIFETQLAAWLSVSRLTMTNGNAQLSGSTAQGGAILSRGTLILFDVAITNCQATGANSTTGAGGNGEGGAIYHSPAIANCSVTNSLIQSCSANGGDSSIDDGGTGIGGAIYLNAGSGLFTQLTITDCDATGGNGAMLGGGADGGGAYCNVGSSWIDSVIENSDAIGGTGSIAAANSFGGGILTAATIGLTNVTIRSCSATRLNGGMGGGVFGGGALYAIAAPVATPTLDITRCLIEQCGAFGITGDMASGGGVLSDFPTNITDTRITACTAAVATGPTSGGGLQLQGNGAMVIQRCTIDGCSGGGVVVNNASSAAFTNCTISGNNGGTTGNASGFTAANAVVTLTFSTIAGNTATGTVTGGLHGVSGSITVIGCIIATNTSASGAPDISGTISNGGNNLVGVAATGFVDGSNGCKVGSAGTPLNPMLATLANNGGRTPTHALQTGSPAIDSGGTVGVPATDQREAPRPFGASADMGSYEFGATPPNTGGQAGGEGDARCSAGAGTSWVWALLALGLMGAVALRRRVAQA